MKKRNSWIITLVLTVLLVLALLFVFFNITKNEEQSSVKQEVSNDNIIDWVAPPKNGEFEQPEGMGIERSLTETEAERSMASLNVSEGSNKSPLTLAVDDEKVKEAAEQLVTVIDKGKYRCAIDWSDYDISDSDYYVLLSLIGKMYEDKLNENSTNYTVIISQPTNEQLDAAGIPVVLDIDNDGYLTMYCNVITQDLMNNTEVEEIKAFTVYYDGDILAFKE